MQYTEMGGIPHPGQTFPRAGADVGWISIPLALWAVGQPSEGCGCLSHIRSRTDEIHRERRRGRSGGVCTGQAVRCAAPRSGADGHQGGVRRGALRRVRRPGGQACGAFVRLSGPSRGRQGSANDRGVGGQLGGSGRTAPAAEGVCGARRGAVRVLHAGHANVGRGAVERKGRRIGAGQRRRDQARSRAQRLPLHRVCQRGPGGPVCPAGVPDRRSAAADRGGSDGSTACDRALAAPARCGGQGDRRGPLCG